MRTTFPTHSNDTMKKILIADAGSTKTDWILVSPEEGASNAKRHTTTGINAAITPDADISSAIESIRSLEGWNGNDIEEVHFYGAGCVGDDINARIRLKLDSAWPGAEIDIQSDLLGAARALHDKEPGVACILGTGSNSGMYDGKQIVANVPSLGFILGDEGSGTALGKRLLADVYKKELPSQVREMFLEHLGMTLPEVIDQVYRRPSPNKFLASFVPFIKENIWNPYLYALVLKEMTSFIKRNVAKYENARRLPIGFVGSIAWYFKDQLIDATDACGFKAGQIIKSPADALAAHHAGSSLQS